MYTGEWVYLSKPVDSRERVAQGLPFVTRIHDDDTAQALGYRAGFVGGLTLLSVTTAAVDASFGYLWYEGGTYSVRHRNPVYEGEMRVRWEEATPEPDEQRRIFFHLEDRQGNLSTRGWAAVPAQGATPVSPWERYPVKHTSIGEDVLPEMQVGTARAPFRMCITLEEAIPRLDAIKDYTRWYRIASPWGDPILTPFDICYALYQGMRQQESNPIRSSRLIAPVDAGTDLVVYAPLFAGRTYIMKPRLCDKWQTERTVFFCTEYTYEDENGKMVAVMRAYSAHLIRALLPRQATGV